MCCMTSKVCLNVYKNSLKLIIATKISILHSMMHLSVTIQIKSLPQIKPYKTRLTNPKLIKKRNFSDKCRVHIFVDFRKYIVLFSSYLKPTSAGLFILNSILWDRSDSIEIGWGLLVDQVRGVYLHWAPVPVRCQVGGQIGGVCLACGLHLPCSSSIWDRCLLRSRGRRWWEGKRDWGCDGWGWGGDGIIALGKMGNWVCEARYHAKQHEKWRRKKM